MTHPSTPAADLPKLQVIGYRVCFPGESELGSWLVEHNPNGPECTEVLHEPLVLKSTAATREAALIAQCDQLRAAFKAACAFIDCHAADPDITNEMCRTYTIFCEKRAAISAPAVSVEGV